MNGVQAMDMIEQLFDFRAEDLQANQNGRLSASQHERIAARLEHDLNTFAMLRRRNLQTILVMVAALPLALLGSFFFRDTPEFRVLIVFVFILLPIIGFIYWRDHKRVLQSTALQSSLEKDTAVLIWEKVRTKHFVRRNIDNRYRLERAGWTIEINEYQFMALAAANTYTLYLFPYREPEALLLSLESQSSLVGDC